MQLWISYHFKTYNRSSGFGDTVITLGGQEKITAAALNEVRDILADLSGIESIVILNAIKLDEE